MKTILPYFLGIVAGFLPKCLPSQENTSVASPSALGPAAIQKIYDDEISAYRNANFMEVEAYIQQLNADKDKELANASQGLPEPAEDRRNAAETYKKYHDGLIAEVRQRFSGSSFTQKLRELTMEGTRIEGNDFSVIRHVSPAIDWSNWEKRPDQSVESIVKGKRKEIRERILAQNGGMEELKRIRKKVEAKYPMYKVGQPLPITLVVGPPTSRVLQGKYLTAVRSNYIMITGNRRIEKQDIDVKDQVRLFKNQHDAIVNAETEKLQQSFLKHIDESTEKELRAILASCLLAGGYVPDPQSRSRYANVFNDPASAPQHWIPMNDVALTTQRALIQQHSGHEVAEKTRRYMESKGYLKISDLSRHDAFTQYLLMHHHISNSDFSADDAWISGKLLDHLRRVQKIEAELESAEKVARDQQGEGKIICRSANGGKEVRWIHVDEAYRMETIHMFVFMKNAGFEPEDYWRDQTERYWQGKGLKNLLVPVKQNGELDFDFLDALSWKPSATRDGY